MGIEEASADLLWNTGVDGSGVVLSPGSTDLNYIITSPTGAGPAIAISRAASTWVAPPSNASWIAPTNFDFQGVGICSFVQHFDLADISGLAVSGRWATDNSGMIFLNGGDTEITRDFGNSGTYGFQALEAFEITEGFIVGTNRLEFRVTNGHSTHPAGLPSGPMGLLVADMTVVPVPGAFLLGSLSKVVLTNSMIKLFVLGIGMIGEATIKSAVQVPSGS
ncbi:MAG: hypothetical protein GY809_31235 [Planctomycetes bacterium]|nr:hypothetical protein [Planctomycetota bacterium]